MGDGCCDGVGKCEDPAELSDDAEKSLGHETCATWLLCAPTETPKTCTTHAVTSTAAGLEGRCIRRCFLLGNPLASLLDYGETCTPAELCVPCYNPADATPTGACNTGTDAPVKAKPAPYVSCPESDDPSQPQGGGACVPKNVLGRLSDTTSPLYNPLIGQLKQDNCAAGEQCVPARKAANPAYCSQHCNTATMLAQINPAVFGSGACTPAYVVFDTNGNAGLQLVSGSGATPCPTGELCSPCANPLTNGTASGTCY